MALLDALIGLFIGLLVVVYVTDCVAAPNSGHNIPPTKEFPTLKITNGKEKHSSNYKQTLYNTLKSYTDLGKRLYGHFKKLLKDDKISHPILGSLSKHANNNWLGTDRTETGVIAPFKHQTASGFIAKTNQDIVRGKKNRVDSSRNEVVSTAGNTNIETEIAGLSLNTTVDKDKKGVSTSGGPVVESSVNKAVDNSARRRSDAENLHRSPIRKDIDAVTVNVIENQGDAHLLGSKNYPDVIANTYVDIAETKRTFKDKLQHVASKTEAIIHSQYSGRQNVKEDLMAVVEKKQENAVGNQKDATSPKGNWSELSSVVSNGSPSNVIANRPAPATELGNKTVYNETTTAVLLQNTSNTGQITTIQPPTTSMKTINSKPSVTTPSYNISNGEPYTLPSTVYKTRKSLDAPDQTTEHLTGYVSKAPVLSTSQKLPPLKHYQHNTNQAPDGTSRFLPSELDVYSAYVAPGIWISGARNSKTLENLPVLEPNVAVFSKSEVVPYPQKNTMTDSGHRAGEITYNAHDFIENTFTNSQLGSQNPNGDTTKSDKVGMANHIEKYIFNSSRPGDKRGTYRDPVPIISDTLDPPESHTISVNQSKQLETTSTNNQTGKIVNSGNGSKHSETKDTKKLVGNTTESNVLNGTNTSQLSTMSIRNQENGTTPTERNTKKASENMTYKTDMDTATNSSTHSEDVKNKSSSQSLLKVHKSRKDPLRNGYGNTRNSHTYNDDSSSEET